LFEALGGFRETLLPSFLEIPEAGLRSERGGRAAGRPSQWAAAHPGGDDPQTPYVPELPDRPATIDQLSGSSQPRNSVNRRTQDCVDGRSIESA
jgi:hypothetical protein